MSRATAQPLAGEVKAPSYNVPLKHVLLTPNIEDAATAAPVAVSLRPNDPLAKRISSTPLSSQNVLVKITVPKRTGRKRKRGSDEPFEASSLPVSIHSGRTVADLLQTMRDNPENHVVEPIGMIHETHRFETIPDFQTRASEVPILREIRDHAMKPKYDSFKDFRIDYRFGIDQNVAYPDPPSFIPTAETFDWQYDQKPDDSATRGKQYRGRPKLLPPPLQSVALSSDTLVVPQAPPPDSAEQSSSRILKAIDAVRELLETRPIVTMRALDAIIETTTMKAISWAVRYLGYYVTSGPWQGAVVKYGIDPRSNPRYRIYQTLNFTLGHNREINSALGKQGHANVVNSHIFDGKTLFGVGRNWQLCDLTDPMIQTLINSPEAIRPDCDMEQHGWLYNGIIAKVRVIMREKLVRIINGASLPQADYFSVLWQLPNQIDVPANWATEGLRGFTTRRRWRCAAAGWQCD
ncbi:RNA polymerase III transcription factor IIIC subunit-domain-containing protein [Neohortaea acidophila]|uniref:RNA polymerase III transcription factor IIIC subunit-domain-containing protein n=1 Tax=Neohortaea acidophila TaxID=245834 RepID=A0A6A6PTF4_9PEZI|nr:RNA polymerase III transcription factor IIIC subunit-domain-containing protein [Neohortaea acidophila]KAF2483380.1 RNA polymerase III transcription factor IIIC subunit-domain-containing protein [Neohortaea acidophila]